MGQGSLDTPASTDDIYLEEGDVPTTRPFFTGDVIAGVQLCCAPTPHSAVMIVSHPCSMRKGHKLADAIQAVPVVESDPIAFSEWATGHYRVFPLPATEANGSDKKALLTETALVRPDQLFDGQRIVALTHSGVTFLQQRRVFNDTRVKVGLDQLMEEMGSACTEISLLDDWCQATFPFHSATADLRAKHEEEAAAFDGVLEQEVPGEPGVSYRDLLHKPRRQQQLIRDLSSFRGDRVSVLKEAT